MNIPGRVGDRYRCFVVERPDRGYGGPYGQTRRPLIWHGGLGLCQRCARRRRVGELIDDGDELREA